MVICLERGAELYVAQLMPVPLTVSCFSKIHIGFAFLVPAHLGSSGQRAIKRMCVCVLRCCSRFLAPLLLVCWLPVFAGRPVISRPADDAKWAGSLVGQEEGAPATTSLPLRDMLPAVQEEARRVDPVSRGWMCVLVQTLYTGQPNMQPLNFQVLCIVTGCFLCKVRVFFFYRWELLGTSGKSI